MSHELLGPGFCMHNTSHSLGNAAMHAKSSHVTDALTVKAQWRQPEQMALKLACSQAPGPKHTCSGHACPSLCARQLQVCAWITHFLYIVHVRHASCVHICEHWPWDPRSLTLKEWGGSCMVQAAGGAGGELCSRVVPPTWTVQASIASCKR